MRVSLRRARQGTGSPIPGRKGTSADQACGLQKEKDRMDNSEGKAPTSQQQPTKLEIPDLTLY